MWTSILVAITLLVLSVCLLAGHSKGWRRQREGELDEKAFDFHRRQYRRRMQASGMIGIVGLAVLGGILIDRLDDAMLSVGYWSAVLFIVAWVGALAIADAAASRFYYDHVRSDHQAEHAALKAELDRLRSREGNGRAD